MKLFGHEVNKKFKGKFWSIGVIQIGSSFQFGSDKKLRIGDVVDFVMNVDLTAGKTSNALWGKAKVVKVINAVVYEAQRIS
jgi:hypothetical protein